MTWVGARAGMTPSMGLAGIVFSGGFARLGDLAIFVVVRASGDGVGAARHHVREAREEGSEVRVRTAILQHLHAECPDLAVANSIPHKKA